MTTSRGATLYVPMQCMLTPVHNANDVIQILYSYSSYSHFPFQWSIPTLIKHGSTASHRTHSKMPNSVNFLVLVMSVSRAAGATWHRQRCKHLTGCLSKSQNILGVWRSPFLRQTIKTTRKNETFLLHKHGRSTDEWISCSILCLRRHRLTRIEMTRFQERSIPGRIERQLGCWPAREPKRHPGCCQLRQPVAWRLLHYDSIVVRTAIVRSQRNWCHRQL